MASSITRRNFLATSAVAAGLLGLASCSGTDTKGDTPAAPSANSYPIDAEEWGSGTVRHSEEVVGQARSKEGFTRVANKGGAQLSVMDTSKLIQVNGYAFKDTNGNGKLDLWEDWRQSPEDRAVALASELDGEKAAALMMHSSAFSLDTDLTKQGVVGDPSKANGKVSLDGDSAIEGEPATVAEALDAGLRTILNFSLSQGTDFAADVRWNNTVQEYVEGLDYAIPVCLSSNPKSLGFPGALGQGATFDPDLVKRIGEAEARAYRSEGVSLLLGPQIDPSTEPRWSRVSGTWGEDPALGRDLTNAYISGLQSTYDADGNDLGWGSESVVGMMKHFPGDGPGESGREAHGFFGKYNVYPGKNFATHLIPFIDGGLHLDSSTQESGGVMTSYSIAYDDERSYGDLVGSCYSKFKIDLLRERCGYDGLICTDWSAAEEYGKSSLAACWGEEDFSMQDHILKIIENDVDQVGADSMRVNAMKEGYKALVEKIGEEDALTRVRESARRILKTMYFVNLPDDPYRSADEAKAAFTDESLAQLATEATDKSIVMLKNQGVIKDAGGQKPTVYIPLRLSDGSVSLPVDEEKSAEVFNVVTDEVGEPTGPADNDGTPTYAASDILRADASALKECDYAVVFASQPSTGTGYDTETGVYIPISLQYGEYVADGLNVREASIAGDPADGKCWAAHDSDAGIEMENRSYFGKSTVASNSSDLALIKDTVKIMGGKPVVTCIMTGNPIVLSEFEPDVQGILMGFGASGDDFLNVVSGHTEPSGLLPVQIPANMDTVEAQLEDVPRDMECHVDSDGNVYDFGFGLNWSGIISDERTEKYCVEPLDAPEHIEL